MANEPDSGSTPVRPVMKKLMYKSPLSGIRSTPYKPPVDKSGFIPIGVSSPKFANNSEGDRFALIVEGPQQGRPIPPNLENQRTPNHGVDSKPSPTGDSSVIPSLMGRGGHWRGPQGNDMSPENRRGGRRYGFNYSPSSGFNSSPSSDEIDQLYSTVPNVNNCSNDSFRRKSFQYNNFTNNSSFGSNPNMQNSPRQFNSADRFHNSSHNNRRRGSGNRGGNHGHRANGDLSVFYSSLMIVDPWSDLMREKMSVSSFQSKTEDRDSGSILNVNLTSDSDIDEGISSQENETLAGDGST